MLNRKIVLASESERRKNILSRIVKDFEIIPSHADEIFTGKSTPEQEALRIADAKASNVLYKAGNDSLIIAADTIVVCDNEIFGKPADENDMKRMLLKLCNKTHEVITAVVCIDKNTSRQIMFAETTEVKFIEYNLKFIYKYIATGEPIGKAGSYAVQGIGSLMVESIYGDYDNIVGLPLSRLVRELEKIGITLF